jgi:uncharacterized membrane protein YciS (DUF1049 family)
MWIIGLLLLAAAIVVGIDIVAMNDQSVDLEAFNQVWTSSPAVTFVVGVVTALVGVFGLWMLITGMRRSRVRRRTRRAEWAERDRLADERRRELDALSTSTASSASSAPKHDADDGMRHTPDREPEPARAAHDDRETVDLRDEQVAEHREDSGMHRSNR